MRILETGDGRYENSVRKGRPGRTGQGRAAGFGLEKLILKKTFSFVENRFFKSFYVLRHSNDSQTTTVASC